MRESVNPLLDDLSQSWRSVCLTRVLSTTNCLALGTLVLGCTQHQDEWGVLEGWEDTFPVQTEADSFLMGDRSPTKKYQNIYI